MTDPHPHADPGPVDPDVELASAHLDGEAGPDERARVDDPAVQAQVAALSAVVDRVRDVPPAPPGMLDDHVARALEDVDAGRRVVAMDSHRTRWWERIPLGAVAAVLVIVAFVGFVGLASQNAGDDDTATASLDSSDDNAAEDGAAATGGAALDAAGGTDPAEESQALESEADMSAPAPVAAYDSYDALADDLRLELNGSERTADQPAPSSDEAMTTDDDAAEDPCGAVGVLRLDPASVVLVRMVLVTPGLVTVVVHDAPDGRRLAAVDSACTVVFDRLL